MTDHWIGYLGIVFGLLVAPPQLIRIIRTRKVKDVSLYTYIFLVCAVSCYLYNAIYIGSLAFTITNGVALIVNSAVLILLIRLRYEVRFES